MRYILFFINYKYLINNEINKIIYLINVFVINIKLYENFKILFYATKNVEMTF